MTLSSSQVSNEIFLQNDYLSLGINAGGSLGTVSKTPSSFYTGEFQRTGLVADTDGFGVGKSHFRDAVLPGTPVEGFSIGYQIGAKSYIKTNQDRNSTHNIDGVTTDISTSTAAAAKWVGTTAEKLVVDQTISLTEDAQYYSITVTLTNTSSTAMGDVHYMRTIDPDHVDFATRNTIVEQGNGSALVTGAAKDGTNPLFIYSTDDRATVSIANVYNKDPYALASTQAAGYSTYADQSLNITFDIGTLAAGKSTTLTFYMGVTNDIKGTIKAIDASQTAEPVTPKPPVNAAPNAVDDSFSLKQDSKISGNVLANDTDANGDALTAALATGPANGTISFSKDGSFVYTPKAGFFGTDSFTYKTSDGKLTDTATVTIKVEEVNKAPNAVDDNFSLKQDSKISGNVLANDTDANGDALTAALATGPANGTISFSKDGSFVYTPKAGFFGTDSFTYKTSDGKLTDTATVTIKVEEAIKVVQPEPNIPDQAAPGNKPTLPIFSSLLEKASVINGSAQSNDKLVGTNQSDAFYFASADAKTGADTISQFGKNDILVLDAQIYDSNNDGIITFSTKNTVRIDGSTKTSDTVKIEGVNSLRYLGTEDGLFVYGDKAVRAKNAIEGIIGDEILSGDAGDKKSQTFFFDTALELNLGKDQINNFGSKDVLLTTTQLVDEDRDGIISWASGGTLTLPGTQEGISSGTLAINNIKGAAINSLEYDGSVQHNGQTFYVYSLLDSDAGLSTVGW
ncbi:MAG: tandem-95 repeat protein [Sphingobium sp.]|nr:tandem-95 repeat protein [Sphingobium sp.]